MSYLPSPMRAVPPLWRESLAPADAASLVRDPIFRGAGMPAGHGRGVLLVPGYLTGDASLATMGSWLRRAGYRTGRTGMRLNAGCSGAAIERLELRLEALYAESGERRVAIVGQSRGGTLARALAARRPDLVSGIVTLGSPLRDQLAIHPLVQMNVRLLGGLGTLGIPGLFRASCVDGDCCATFRASVGHPLAEDVGFVSVYSKRDGIVDWRSCLAPGAEHVEVDATHLGMGLHGATYRAIAAALRAFRDADLGVGGGEDGGDEPDDWAQAA